MSLVALQPNRPIFYTFYAGVLASSKVATGLISPCSPALRDQHDPAQRGG